MCRIIITDNEHFLDSAKPILKFGGPDDQNLIIIDNVNYYHTRLSIQGIGDVGKQPLVKNNRVLLFNGEIYNKEYLSEKYLSSSKYDCDTYLIFDLIEKFGHKIIDDFEGMFSIIWKDFNCDFFYIARDVFGKKPLYFKNSKEDWFISSQYDWYSANEDNSVFKIFGFYPEPFTAFLDVFSFPSGQVIKFLPGENYEIIHHISLSSKRINLHEALISDIPLILAYSGGVDSSLLNSIYNEKVDTISIGKLPPHSLVPSFSVKLNHDEYNYYIHKWKELKGMKYSIDGFNTFVLTDICKKNGYKVVISGTGGDELFSGYRQHRFFILIYILSFFPHFMIRFLIKIGGRFNRFNWLFNQKLPRKLRVYLTVRSLIDMSLINLNPELLSKLNLIYENRVEYFNRFGYERVFANLEMSIFLKSRLLRDSDYFSMMNGVEVRSPLLNKGLLTKINSNFFLNSCILPNKLGSLILFKKIKLIRKSFYKKEGFFINIGNTKSNSLL